jgi:hypothetical protein
LDRKSEIGQLRGTESICEDEGDTLDSCYQRHVSLEKEQNRETQLKNCNFRLFDQINRQIFIRSIKATVKSLSQPITDIWTLFGMRM